MKNNLVYIIGGQRTPFQKSFTGFKDDTTQDLMTDAMKALVEKFHLQNKILGDVALGAVINSSLKWGLARESTLGSGLSPYTPACFIQRACGTGLEASIFISNKITVGQIEWGIAGGVDTNSDLPLLLSDHLRKIILQLRNTKTFGEKLKTLLQLRLHDFKPAAPEVREPRTGLSMGEHCEKMVKEWNISRAEQDELALISHQNAAKAYEEGFYNDLITTTHDISKDGIVRADTTLDKLAKLKTVFDTTALGTLTAGNSSPLTDGASAVLLANEISCQQESLKPLARFVDAEVAAIDYVGGDGLLMAPTIAVSRLLQRHNLTLQDFDYYEIHEAFAGQVLCTLKAWESDAYAKKFLQREQALGPIDRNKMNIKGGSLALGHPFAATGGRIVASLAKMLSKESAGKRGLISICTAGGMGVAAIIESI
ncbi:MAG: acetyl-CoA C-acetyltransferase [Gammaproteobacteria bacterium]|nr:acetyl-CoA C-acetyltransferase [Gammaproteobacteria bacterium]